MGSAPTKGCLLATLYALKLSFYYVIFSQCLNFFITQSPLIEVDLRTISYSIIVIGFIIMASIAFILDAVLLVSMSTAHYNFTKRLAAVDAWFQTLCFLPILIALIVLTSIGVEKHLEPRWKLDFLDPQNYTIHSRKTFLADINNVDSDVNRLQKDLRCCGYYGHDDWKPLYPNASGNSIPDNRNITSINEDRIGVPDSCCYYSNCTKAMEKFNASSSHKFYYEQSCLKAEASFIFRFTLVMSIFLLLVILTTIPLNMWLYYFTEVKRRKARLQACTKFVKMLRTENDVRERQIQHQRSLLKTTNRESESQKLLSSAALDALPPRISVDDSVYKKKNVTIISSNLTIEKESNRQQRPGKAGRSKNLEELHNASSSKK